jgi:hypothetical protein
MAITAKIGSNNSNGPKKVSVTVPVQQNLVRNSDFLLKALGDVDANNAQEGALLQYRASDRKFVARTELETDQGTLVLNGGAF